MGFLDRFKSKPKVSDLAEQIAKQEYMKERIRQAKKIGIAKAQAESKQKIQAIKKAPTTPSSGFGGFIAKTQLGLTKIQSGLEPFRGFSEYSEFSGTQKRKRRR